MKLFLRGLTALTLCTLVVFGTGIARADITGTISGIVTDPSGAVIPGATVVATAASTNVQHTTVTDGRGFYAFPTLSVDHYTISLTQSGYDKFELQDVIINANSAVRVDITLKLGQVTNTVSVKDNAVHVETESTQMGQVIDGPKITAMPLNGRSFIDLLALQPGVSPYQGNDTSSGVGASTLSGDQTNGTQSVNGGRVEANGFMVNGADAEEGVHNGAAMIPNADSIAQFRIITNNFNAEYGNFSGGQINVVTKSGTNQFHGEAFDFLRNTDLDAANYFSARGVYIQNQFGGTFGGPVLKNKLFFFADYQGTRQIIGATQNFPVPSFDERNGNLNNPTDIGALSASDPANGGQGVVGSYWAGVLSQKLGYTVTAGEPYYTTGCTTSSQCVFPNAQIPQSAWSSVAVNTLKYIPVSNTSSPNGPLYETSAFNGRLKDDKGGFRMDATTPYGALFGYYFIDKFKTINPYDQGINIPGFDDQNTGQTQMYNFGLTTTIGPNLVNDIRLVYLRDVNFTGVPVQGTGVSLSSLGFNTPWNPTGGISNITSQLAGVPSFFFNNYQFGLAQDTLRQYNNTVQLIDNVIKVAGTHTIQFGIDVHYDQINERNFDDPNGAFGFNGSETGLDFADYLIGATNNFTQASQQLLDSRAGYYGGYVQDSWRASRQLTVNYGLRYEVMTPWYDTQNKLETVVAGEQSKAFPGAPTGLVVPGDPGIPRTLSPIKYTNFAPRIGFAYSPDLASGFLSKIFGTSGKSSIRAGYGIFYSAIQNATGFVEVGDAPYGLYYSSPVPPLLDSPFIDRATGNNEGIKFPFTFPATNVSPKNPDTTFNWVQATPISGADYFYSHNVIPYVQEFNLSLQRQLGSATVLSVSYVGNVGRHLLTFEESNPANPALCLQLNAAAVAPNTLTCGPNQEDSVFTLANGTTVNGTRPTFGINFGSNPYMKTAVSSSFNSLQISVEHNEKYANFLIGYTLEKSIDNGSTAFDATNPYNPALSRALSVFNVPQDLVASYTVQLPFNNLTGKGALSTRVAGGWSISGVSTFASGQPVQLAESDDNSLTGTFNDTIDEPSYANNGSKLFVNRNPRSQQPYFNPNYFVPEPLGQVGNAMRRYFSGPGILNSDMALEKETKIMENQSLNFRAEAFNVFNHAQFNNPNGQVDNTGANGFGYTLSTRDPRIMQVALKYVF
ncbi:TonB-dependent receptor [Paracidobacterium acidisoli]|nr:carboxypeptidase regulatory-like domain-containing protein [Paracidobacterium acidisoli]MBT9332671.1 carboxypeptidase regulatory-like domain-containing protein [Paracidobacterium acidisoli]